MRQRPTRSNTEVQRKAQAATSAPKAAHPAKKPQPARAGAPSAKAKAPPPAALHVTLPVVPESVQASPLALALLHVAAFLDLSDDEVVEPKLAGGVLERVGLYVQRLDDDSVEQLADDLARIEAHAVRADWPAPAREFVHAFLENCGFVAEGADDTSNDVEELDDEAD